MHRLRGWWPVVKLALGLVIVVAIGLRFSYDLRDHPELWRQSLRPGWLLLCAVLYLVGLGFSALYWHRLLRVVGQRPPLLQALRAYYLGHMGKYVPGKAYAIVLRADLVRGPQVGAGLAALTAFYEVLVTMAAGALVAAALFALLLPDTAALDTESLRRLLTLQAPEGPVLNRPLAVALALLILAPLLLATFPPAFNRLAHRLTLPFRKTTDPLPHLTFRHLAEGLLLTGTGWLCLGTSFWAALQGVLGEPPAWGAQGCGRLTAFLGVAYVAGFVILIAPGGVGVREFFLVLFLVADPGLLPGLSGDSLEAAARLVVVVLRLVWTAAELAMVAAVWRLPVGPGAGAPGGGTP